MDGYGVERMEEGLFVHSWHSLGVISIASSQSVVEENKQTLLHANAITNSTMAE